VLLAPVVIPAVAFGGRRETWALFGELVAILAALLFLPKSLSGAHLAGLWTPIGIGLSIVFAVWLCVVNIVTITGIYTRAAVTAARMRDEVLDQHDARARGLETLGAKVAHELKNPLAAIAGLVQLLLEGEHAPKTRERLVVVSSEVERVEAILRRYLAFSRPLEDVRPVQTDVALLVDDVLALLEARAAGAGVRVVRTGGDVTATVDPGKLKDALLNLVDNALEASPRGRSVTVEITHEPGRTLVRVRDEGEGIPADVLARVGTPYFTTREKGTGLGVVMARAAVEAHGGTLTLRSKPGEGTIAEIALPDDAAARAA